MLRKFARVGAFTVLIMTTVSNIFVNTEAAVGRDSLQDVPLSVSKIAEAGIRQLNVQELKDLTAFTPSVRFGQNMTNGAKIQIRGALNTPGYYVDGVHLNFAGAGIDVDNIENVEVLRGPQGTLLGDAQIDPQNLSDMAQVFDRVLNAQEDEDLSALAALKSTAKLSRVPTVEQSGLLQGFDQVEQCSPQQFNLVRERAFSLELQLSYTAKNYFAAETGRDYARGMSDAELESAFQTLMDNEQLRLGGFKSQLGALAGYTTTLLEAGCPPFNADMTWQPSWLDATLGLDAQPFLASQGPSGSGDIGSRRPQGFDTQLEGEFWLPDANGQWGVREKLNFSNADASDLLAGRFTDRCQRYEGPTKDFKEYAFSASLTARVRQGLDIDFSLPLYDNLDDVTDPGPFQQYYADALTTTKRRLCEDPLDYSRKLDFKLDLSYQLREQVVSLGFLNYAQTPEPGLDLRYGDLRVGAAVNWDYRTAAGDQSGYEQDPDYRFRSADFSRQRNLGNYRFSQSVDYRAARSYTFPNISPSNAFMPDCFKPQHYGTFRIGLNEYVRVFIDPLLLLRLNMQGLEVVGVFLDPFRGPQTDPYMQPTAAGGGAWGQSFDDQWAVKKVGFTDNKRSAWSNLDSQSTQSVVVAVIDTGLDWHHQDISATNLWRNSEEIADNGIDDDGNGYVDDVMGYDFMERHGKPWDYHGHGTMVSGIIAATRDNDIGIAGINSKAEIMVLRVTNSFGNTNASYIAEAIAYAVDNGAAVINISMGGAKRSHLEAEAIQYARDNGVLVVAAAGNEGIELEDYGPGAEDGVFTVAATDLNNEPAGFSNTGDAVDIAAPGVDVLSLRARGTDVNLGASGDAYALGDYYVGADKRYIRASGTSFAAPIVTGAASALLSLEPGLSPDDIKARLTATAWDVHKPGPDPQTGAGLLDARTALGVDEHFFITATVGRLVPNAESETLEIYGDADADQFKRAWLQIGESDDPQSWKYVGLKLKRPVKDALLSEIPLSEFAGTGVWTVRVNVEHASGTVRRATKVVRLK